MTLLLSSIYDPPSIHWCTLAETSHCHHVWFVPSSNPLYTPTTALDTVTHSHTHTTNWRFSPPCKSKRRIRIREKDDPSSFLCVCVCVYTISCFFCSVSFSFAGASSFVGRMPFGPARLHFRRNSSSYSFTRFAKEKQEKRREKSFFLYIYSYRKEEEPHQRLLLSSL